MSALPVPDPSPSEPSVEPSSFDAVSGTVPNADVTISVAAQTLAAEPSAASFPHTSQPSTPTNETSSLLAPTSSTLAIAKGSFEAFLAPLTTVNFKKVVEDVEKKLRVVNQTLTMLDSLLDSQDFEAILNEMLRSITLKTGELLNADRTTIYLRDEDKKELWSIVAKDDNGSNLELRFPETQGIAGEVATSKRAVNIAFDFYDDPRAGFAKQTDQATGYRTYTMLVMPLLDNQDSLVAVVQLINKLKPDYASQAPLDERIDPSGFSEVDEDLFNEFAPSIRLILESSRSFYRAAQKQRAASALMKATQALSQSSLDLSETLERVMNEAKELMQADRSTLWLLDEERQELWTRIPIQGELQEYRIPKDAGFAGQAATTQAPVIVPFDLYNDPNAEKSKETDRHSGYRTCSILCMPVFNTDGDLIGVTQLINKVRQGEFPPYNPAHWPEAPERWRASFNRTDLEFMQAFNTQAGVALQNAKLFDTVKQQELMQRDILRSLSNGVLSTDHEGRIIAANSSARALLHVADDVALEGRRIDTLIAIEELDFSACFRRALSPEGEGDRRQYYPEQTLDAKRGEVHPVAQHSVHLSINSIADAKDASDVYGALVVMDDISDEKRLKSTMYRYMSQEVAEQLLSSGELRLGGDRKEVSVLFSDIRSFTTIAESMDAEELVIMLNDYFETMVDAVMAYKGTLDKYIGDAIMAVFGSPLALEDHAWRAVQTSIEMRHRLEDFNRVRETKQQPPIKIGIGINSGSVISGNIGSSKRMEFTAIGDGVNLGARLEGATKQYGCDIVISENTYRPCADQVWALELDRIRVKGKTEPVAIYHLVGLRSETLSDREQRRIDLYTQGRRYYLNRQFTKALTQFGQVLEDIDCNDKAASEQLKRCQHWLENPPPEDWDGVWSLTQK
ncbi:MAG: GAF domain-containing protein [Elainellaceae cyanobacterium]